MDTDWPPLGYNFIVPVPDIDCIGGIDAFASFRSNDFGKTNGCIFIMDGKFDGGCVAADNDDADGGSVCGSCDVAPPAYVAAVDDDDDTVASISEVCDDDLLVAMGHP